MIATRTLAPDRHALVAHLVAHLAYSTAMVRVVSRLSATTETTALRLAMDKVLPVLQDEFAMLRALVDSIGGESATTHRAASDARATSVAAAGSRTEAEWAVTPDAPGATMAEALDELLVGCWGRYAIWRALAGRCQPDDALVRPEFDALAERSQLVICELETLQECAGSLC